MRFSAILTVLALNGYLSIAEPSCQQLPSATCCYPLEDEFGRGKCYYSFDNRTLTSFQYKPPKRGDVKLTIYTRKNRQGVIFYGNDPDYWTAAKNCTFYEHYDPTKPIKFITHGWRGNSESDSVTQIKDGFLYKYDANVITVDWSSTAADCTYVLAAKATEQIGNIFGEFLYHLISRHNANQNSIHLVGHGLGAHISGYAGRAVIPKGCHIGRLTALDPLGPGFTGTGFVTQIVDFLGNTETQSSLTGLRHVRKTDAKFVDAIHTDSDKYGMREPVGHADFYPNGGAAPQPGCSCHFFTLRRSVCSHNYSWRLFASGLTRVLTDQYKAYHCPNLQPGSVPKFDNTYCHVNSRVHVPMGDLTPTNASGIFYSNTAK